MVDSGHEDLRRELREHRGYILDLVPRVSHLEEREQRWEHQQDQQDQSISLLTTLVRGNEQLKHSGLIDQIGEIKTTVNSIKEAQDVAKRDQERAKDRWKFVLLGLSFSALPGVKILVDVVKTVVGATP